MTVILTEILRGIGISLSPTLYDQEIHYNGCHLRLFRYPLAGQDILCFVDKPIFEIWCWRYKLKKPSIRQVIIVLVIIGLSGIYLGTISGCSGEEQNTGSDPTSESSTNNKADDQPSSSAQADSTTKGPADNSSCLVCHIDFQEETLSIKHEESGVGCKDCHGVSEDHSQDELNILFPDVMFGRAEVVPFCTSCHKQEEHPKGDIYQLFLKKWTGKYRPHGRLIHNNSICTDCHGEHARLDLHQMHFPTE